MVRNPLVIVSGKVAELPAGDTITGVLGQSGTDWRSGLSEITITTNSTQAIQNAIDAAGPSGRKIIFPASLGTYNATDYIAISDKQNIVLTGLNNPTWQTAQGNYEFIRFLGNNKNIDVTNLKLVNTLSSTATPNVALIHGYEQGPNLSIRLAGLDISAPNLPQNLITFTPFSPLNESGNGVGNPLNDLLVEDCYLHDGGRCAIEINTHVYKDNRYESFLNRPIIRRNIFQRIGTKDTTNTIPVLTFGGVSKDGQIYQNTIIDGTYAAIELVSSQNYKCWDNNFAISSAWGNKMSGYAITQNPGRPARNIDIWGGSGYVNGRAFLLNDIEGIRVNTCNYLSDKFSDIQRIKNGVFENVKLKTFGYAGSNPDGGNVMQIRDTTNFHVFGGEYELLNRSGETGYSVIAFPSGGNNVGAIITGATLKRPAGSNDSSIHVESNTELIDNQNTEIN